MAGITVFRWLLDVGPIWENPAASKSRLREATAQWAREQDVQDAMSLLTDEEKAKVLRFYRPSDAKLSLGSFLLKHNAIARTCGVSWSEAIIGEDSKRKPCYKKPSNPEATTMEFNVSHHGDLVALVGCPGSTAKLGVDIVKMNWVKDYALVLRDGFRTWASTYEMVFSDREVNDIAGYEPPVPGTPEEKIRAQLRHFYAHWCLKEAYVKMTGEALLAPWLRDVEFRNVQVPLPTSRVQHSRDINHEWGQTCTDVEIWWSGSRVTHVKLEIQAFREDYMIATASSNVDVPFSAFEMIDVERKICSSSNLEVQRAQRNDA
ncbi:hypothetical protein MMC21_006734 [Puttea exsequens]|nr:hypothetical protein [Puttea exsequens]